MIASSLSILNTWLNVLMLLGLIAGGVFFGPRAFRASVSKAREDEMQRTIEAYKGRVEALEPQVESLQAEVKECRDTATRWEARYHEQAKYTAEGALTAVLGELAQTRHVIETSMEGLGDLMMEHSKLVAASLDRLDGAT